MHRDTQEKESKTKGYCSICEKHTENGYCYIHPFGHREYLIGHREYLICPNCLMYSTDPLVKEARIGLRSGGRKR